MVTMPGTRSTGRRMSRRDLGKFALLSTTALEAAQPAAAQPAQSNYASALDGLESKVDLAAFDPVAFTKKLHDAAPLRLTFRARTRGEALDWQKKLRANLVQ